YFESVQLGSFVPNEEIDICDDDVVEEDEEEDKCSFVKGHGIKSNMMQKSTEVVKVHANTSVKETMPPSMCKQESIKERYHVKASHSTGIEKDLVNVIVHQLGK
ncbi:MAG: hypothetical protein ACRCZO_05830, partial [Cetobacterium sp.]